MQLVNQHQVPTKPTRLQHSSGCIHAMQAVAPLPIGLFALAKHGEGRHRRQVCRFLTRLWQRQARQQRRVRRHEPATLPQHKNTNTNMHTPQKQHEHTQWTGCSSTCRERQHSCDSTSARRSCCIGAQAKQCILLVADCMLIQIMSKQAISTPHIPTVSSDKGANCQHTLTTAPTILARAGPMMRWVAVVTHLLATG